jgi:hypothetical protein
MKTHLMIVISEAQKDALGEYATKHNKSIAAVVRESIAVRIGYDLAAEAKPIETRGRPRKYASDAERKEANRARSAEQRKLVKQLLDAYRSGQHKHSIKVLEESISK